MKQHVTALRRAVAIAGGQAQLAEAIAAYLRRPTVKQQTISYWLRSETRVDAEWWSAIEHATGGKVTREDLRPDVFGPAS